MTRPTPDDRPLASMPAVDARRRRPADEASGLASGARVADALARAFGVLVVLATLATAFGGWLATLR